MLLFLTALLSQIYGYINTNYKMEIAHQVHTLQCQSEELGVGMSLGFSLFPLKEMNSQQFLSSKENQLDIMRSHCADLLFPFRLPAHI